MNDHISEREPLITSIYISNLTILSHSDDTSVSIVEKNANLKSGSTIHFLENVTADSREYRGIHPIIALESHQQNLSKVVAKAIAHLPVARPDFVSATRGPGMRSNLSVGLDIAKGLSLAWQVPLVGVHHMQAHLLTPRLVSSLAEKKDGGSHDNSPDFPFLSILVSGGHSLLVHSSSITDHQVLASSEDIAIGESLDKAAREILPTSVLESAKSTMYGKALEQFAFPNGRADYADYKPPMTRGEELIKHNSPWGWSITAPFSNTRQLEFSFSSIAATVSRIISRKKAKLGDDNTDHIMEIDERVALARESMRISFEHLASRTVIALEALNPKGPLPRGSSPQRRINTLVVSGGVAANQFLMTILRSFLDVRGFGHVDIIAPPAVLCTDNAAMIGWAGIEMFEAGWRTDLGVLPLRKWSLDAREGDGGILGPDGWLH